MNQSIIAFILCNVAVFFLPTIVRFSGGGYNSFTSFLARFERSNVKIRDGEWYRLVTSMFLHANLIHLVLNMYVLLRLHTTLMYFFAPGTELLGFFLVYFFSGIAGSVTSFFTNPNPSVGASGAIFGIIGAILAAVLRTGQTDLLVEMVIFVALNIYLGSQLKMVNNSAHIGGLVAGFVLMLSILFFAPQLTIV